jgi:membrane protein DedA with SNARE-associated domain
MTHLLVNLVSQFGYLIVFLGVGMESLGVPVPGETSLVIGAAVAAQGHLAPWGVALAGFGGAVVGDNTGYWVGRRWGPRLLTVRGIRRLYSPERRARAESLFERRGWIAVFFGRFVALLRIFAGPLAGSHRMPWPRFLVANASGGAVWVAAVTTVGLLLGSNLGRAIRLVSRAGYAGLAIAVILAAGFGIRYLRRRRRECSHSVELPAERPPARQGSRR